MTSVVTIRVRRWWWSRFSPFVRAGWVLVRTDTSTPRRQALLGAGLMAVGLMLRPRRRTVLYSQVLEGDGAITVRVRPGRRTTTVV